MFRRLLAGFVVVVACGAHGATDSEFLLKNGGVIKYNSRGRIERGEWTSQFIEARKQAKKENVPLLIYWSNYGCGNCETLEARMIDRAFTEWQKEYAIYMTFNVGGYDGPAGYESWDAKEAARDPSGAFPYIGVYWGGRKMGTFTGNGLSVAQFIAKVKNLLKGWIAWNYYVEDGGVVIGGVGEHENGRAVPGNVVGAVRVLSSLGGHEVTGIGKYAFYNCAGMTAIQIPSSVKSIGENAFSGCDNLMTISVPRGEMERVRGLVVNSGFDIDKISFVEFAEDGGPYVETVNDVEWTYYVEDGEATLRSGWRAVEDDDVFDTAISRETTGPISIPSVLGGCPVTSVGNGAMSSCEGLTSVTIPSSVMFIGECAFAGCSGLEAVAIPENVLSIGRSAFYGCDGLMSMRIPSRFSVRELFCYAEEWDGEWETWDDEDYYIPEMLTEMTLQVVDEVICDYALADCWCLTTLTISGELEAIGVSAFSGCRGLESISLPLGVTSIASSAFEGCDGLNIQVNEDDAARIRSMLWSGTGAKVYVNGSLIDGGPYQEIVGGVEWNFMLRGGKAILEGNAWGDPAILTGTSGSITVPAELCGHPVTSIGNNAFLRCGGLTSVTIPDGVEAIASGAFAGCEGLTSMTIPLSVTSIGLKAFEGCPKITTATIPSRFRASELFPDSYGKLTTVTTLAVDGVIGARALEGCRSLVSVTISGDVEEIGESAFENCRHLESIVIPAAVKKIDAGAFYGCWRLKTVEYLGNEPEVDIAAFSGTGIEQRTSTIDTVNVVVSNVVVQYVLNGVQPQFVIPATIDTGFVNIIAEVKGGCVAVPATWTVNYPSFTSKFGSDFTKALAMKTGKKDGAGNEMLVWQDYVAGTDPTDETDVFTASITIVDGKVAISYTPELDDARKAMRKYTTWGKTSLMDTDWTEVPKGDEGKYNFFKVSVEMQ